MNAKQTHDRFGPVEPAYCFLSDAVATRIDWLWPGRLPLGALSLLIGEPGVGKSFFTADVAARITAPQPWPDDPADERGDSGAPVTPSLEALSRAIPPVRGFACQALVSAGVVFAAPEDQGVLPGRLVAAGADASRVSVLHGVRPAFTRDVIPLRLPAHAEQLEEAIAAHDHPRLVVLDPIHLLLDDGVFASQDLQAGLFASLADLARRRGVAILAVGHFTKKSARRVLHRIRGSLGLVAAARSILLLTQDPDDPDRRILTQVKSAYACMAPPLAFRIADADPRVEWDDAANCDWRLATGELDLSAESFSVLSETCDWLTDCLSAGPKPAREVLNAARAAGIPRVTLVRAKRLLGVASRRSGTTWMWLPAGMPA